jgi:hypothetical protein
VVVVIDDVPVGNILVFSAVLSLCSRLERTHRPAGQLQCGGYLRPWRLRSTGVGSSWRQLGRRSEGGWYCYALIPAVRAPCCFLCDEIDRLG